MKHSIRARFTFLFTAVFLLVLLTSVVINSLGLERFYRAQKVKQIEKAYQALDALIMREGNESGNLESLLREYSDKYNITIAVMDSDNSRAITTSERDGDFLFRRAQSYLLGGKFSGEAVVVKETEKYQIISTPEGGGGHIDCFAFCSDNRTLLLISTPLADVKESARLVNRFLSYVGLFTVFLGLVLGFFLTRWITDPIRQLAVLSEKMGRLDFSERYIGHSEDEIGTLGRSMNAMSEKLEETFAELKSANEQLTEDIRKKEEIDEMRREFIANVSHELKTPIALIQGYAEGLNEGLMEDPESRKEYLDVIIDEAGRMNGLVKQLLTLSKLESGAPELEISTFDIREMIRGIASSSRLLAEEKKAVIAFDEPEEPLMVKADAFQIEEVLTNYISNAVHHVNEGGRIVIWTEKASPDFVRVHVANTGSHIPEKDLPHIWDKFYKVDKSHSRSYGGSGIGLSIVKAVMEAHGGAYGVENTEDGVDFHADIPG